ncbi:hypothetical protein [Aliivibrio fischeri]|uniref:hypothetical protein n=1 Tax=Aliivibrio fischeri TaxID=668 RepID=UPI0007C5D2CD|nr:hypothetical protein [Aliivibrio fischeri]
MNELILSLHKNIDSPLASYATLYQLSKELHENSINISSLRKTNAFLEVVSLLKKEERSKSDRFNRLIKKAFRMSKAINIFNELKINSGRETLLRLYLNDNQAFDIIKEFHLWLAPTELKKVKQHINWCENYILINKKETLIIGKIKALYIQYEKIWLSTGKTDHDLEQALRLTNRHKNLQFKGKERDLLNQIKNSTLDINDYKKINNFNLVSEYDESRHLILNFFDLLTTKDFVLSN